MSNKYGIVAIFIQVSTNRIISIKSTARKQGQAELLIHTSTVKNLARVFASHWGFMKYS